MDWSLTIAGAVFLLQVLSLVATVTWLISKIKSAGDVLNGSLRSLKESVDELKGTMQRLADRQDDHAERISRLEGPR